MTSQTLTRTALRLAGRPADWQIRKRTFRRPQPGVHSLGPLAVIASVALSWLAFANATGDGNVAFGLFIGATSILLMAWSFVLAIRLRFLERFFGGLDSMYRVHRWAGTLAVVAMFLHVQIEPEIEGGIRGASRSLANTAEDLAGAGEIMLYVLVAISLLRWFPYRWWRWTHKLLGVPFAFASFHFFTAEKPYANNSAWGWYFGIFMVAGLAGYLTRVVGKDVIARGTKYQVEGAELVGSTLDLRLQPVGHPITHRAGQFAVLKFDEPGLREPHVFTIASGPDEPSLRFFIKDLGDWTSQLHATDIAGVEVVVEGPYGEFSPLTSSSRTVWVAGGVGITPFLSAASALEPSDDPPTLHYLIKTRSDAVALDLLELHTAVGRIKLVLHVSSEGDRFTAESLHEHYGDNGLAGAHVAVCGPASLVTLVDASARQLGAADIEREDFDIRQGFGPDLPSLPGGSAER